MKSKAQIVVNGKTFVGRCVRVDAHGNVFVDGQEAPIEDARQVSIVVHGDVDQLDVAHCERLSIAGDVRGNVQTATGEVHCRDVGGNVQTATGDVTCSKVSGNVHTATGRIR